MTTRLLALPLAFGAIFAVTGCPAPEEAKPPEQPKADAPPVVAVAPPPRLKKTMAELLVGNWKRVKTEEVGGELIHEFTADGRFIERHEDPVFGPRSGEGRYRLDGNAIVFLVPPTPPLAGEIYETTTTIESVTEDKLVTVTRVRRRMTPERAQELADVRMEPVEKFLAIVKESRNRTTWTRIK